MSLRDAVLVSLGSERMLQTQISIHANSLLL